MDVGRQDTPRRRRARPVADAPVDELLLRTEDLTKGWLLALLEQAPLDEAPAILAADVARDGPRLCDAIVRALADETDLRRLEPGGALEMLVAQTGVFAGAQGVAATSRAVDALGAIVWSALRDTLVHPEPDLVTELAERLSLVMELVRGAVLRRLDTPEVPALASQAAGESQRAEPLRPRVVPDDEADGDRRPGAAGPAPPLRARDEIVDPDALWVGALEDEIARCERTGTPLSLLLVELEDSDRVASVEPPHRATATFGRFAQAVRSVLRRQDMLACESDTRAWIIARDTGRIGAQALGSRIVGAVRAAPAWRGAPLAVSVGVAVLGEDGRDRGTLVEAAEESRYEAEASGAGIAGDPLPWRDPPA